VKARRRLLVALTALALLAGTSPLLFAEVLYRYALAELGQPPAPPGHRSSSLLTTAFWLAAGERFPQRSEPLAAWQYGWALAYGRPAPHLDRPGERVALLTARQWLSNRAPVRHTKYPLLLWAATVWTSRHWDAFQTTQVWMDTAYLGRGARGVAAGAAAYFGKPAEELSLDEIALLVGLARSPSGLDPTCSPERAQRARNRVLEQLLTGGVISATDYHAAVGRPLTAAWRSCP